MSEYVYTVSPVLETFKTRHEAAGYAAIMERRFDIDQTVVPVTDGREAVVKTLDEMLEMIEVTEGTKISE